MSLLSRLSNVIRGERLSREIDEEIESHIQAAIEAGRDPVEARRAFGSALRRREESCDIKLIPWLDSLRADVVFGWRQLKNKKVASAVAVLSLALAIGACASAARDRNSHGIGRPSRPCGAARHPRGFLYGTF